MLNSLSLLILFIPTKHKKNKMKSCTNPMSSFLYGELIHWVDKTENVRLLVWQLAIKTKPGILAEAIYTTIRPEFSVPTDLFILFAYNHSAIIYGALSFNLSFVQDHSTKN